MVARWSTSEEALIVGTTRAGVRAFGSASAVQRRIRPGPEGNSLSSGAGARSSDSLITPQRRMPVHSLSLPRPLMVYVSYHTHGDPITQKHLCTRP